MSYAIQGVTFSRLSSGDMSSGQYHAVQASTTNSVDGCVLVAARGAALVGIYQNNSTAQEAGEIQLTGIAKVVAGDSSAGAAIAAGDNVVCSSKGRAVASTAAGQHLIGKALEPLGASSTGIIAVALAIGAIST